MAGEALGESAMSSMSSSRSHTNTAAIDMQGYPPDMMLAPGPAEAGLSSHLNQGI